MAMWRSWLAVAAVSRFGGEHDSGAADWPGDFVRRRSLGRKGVSSVAVVDVAPFVVFLVVGAVAGRFLSGSAAWLVALFPPAVHLGLSVVTGRAGEDLFSYVVPVNLLLLGLAALGLLAGRALRRRTRATSSESRAPQVAGRQGRGKPN